MRVCAAMMREYCYAHLRLTVQNKGMFTQDLLFFTRVNALYLKGEAQGLVQMIAMIFFFI